MPKTSDSFMYFNLADVGQRTSVRPARCGPTDAELPAEDDQFVWIVIDLPTSEAEPPMVSTDCRAI